MIGKIGADRYYGQNRAYSQGGMCDMKRERYTHFNDLQDPRLAQANHPRLALLIFILPQRACVPVQQPHKPPLLLPKELDVPVLDRGRQVLARRTKVYHQEQHHLPPAPPFGRGGRGGVWGEEEAMKRERT